MKLYIGKRDIQFMRVCSFIIAGKFVSSDMVARRVAKCGDGTHYLDCDEVHRNAVWGLGDKDIPKEDLDELATMNQ